MLADKHMRALRLREAIAARYATFKEAADRHHFKEPTLTSHANGTRAFDLDQAYQYAKAFKVDPAWLMGLDPSNPTPVAQPLNVNAVASVLADALRRGPKEGWQVSDAPRLARAIEYGLRVSVSDPAKEPSEDALGVAARAAVDRLLDERHEA